MNNKNIKAEDFVFNTNIMKPITEYCVKELDGSWSINTSSIFSKLITFTGRFCESYASDIFLDLLDVYNYLEHGLCEDKIWLFGIRQMGVDHAAFVLNNSNNLAQYRAIFKLKAKVNEDKNKLTLTLGRVH